MSTTTVEGAAATIVHLNRSLRDLSRDGDDVTLLPRRFVLGQTDETAFTRVADVAAMDSGRFAVLDGAEAHITIHDSTGALVSTIGRQGQGPGEFSSPWGLGYGNGKFVVWQPSGQRTFTVISIDGRVHETRPAPVAGDWINLTVRYPLKRLDDVQHGPEEITHRLRSDLSRTDWIQLVQADERVLLGARNDTIRPPVHVLRFHFNSTAVDTVAEFDGVYTFPERRTPEGYVRAYVQPTFSPRPVAAAGDGWVAFGTGDSAFIRVLFDDQRSTIEIRWPPIDEGLSMADKLNHASWIRDHAHSTQAEAAEAWSKLSRRERERTNERFVTREPWSARVPQITAMWGGGACLLVAGFASDQTPFGQATRMVLINVNQPTQPLLVRIPHGRRLRAIGPWDIFAVSRGEMGEWLVEAYRLPFSCSGATS